MVGQLLFQNSIPVYGAFLLVPIAWWILNRTTLGLKNQIGWADPAAADSLGINVDRIRYFSVCLGAILAGLAGATLSTAVVNLFQDNLTAGQGFIAVALVYFGGWIYWGSGRRIALQLRQFVTTMDAGIGRQNFVSCCCDAPIPDDHCGTDD